MYSINPCKAALEKYKDALDKGHLSVNGINNTCYDVCGAFSGVGDSWQIPDDCAKNCMECVSNIKASMCRNDCDYKAPRRPPIFNQTPHYFPNLLEQTKDPAQALHKCMKLCEKTSYPGECKETCRVDMSAVQMKHTPQRTKETYREQYKHKKNHNKKHKDDGPDYRKYSKAHPWAFYLTFIAISIIFIIALWVFIRFLTSSN